MNLSPANNMQSQAESDTSKGPQKLQHRHNFLILTFYHVILRVGWIFKTESVVMPAILDTIGGGGWLRGCLPMLNRLGQSLPPLFVSDQIRRAPYKTRVLVTMAGLMGISFVALAGTWFLLGGEQPNWLPYWFLLVYAVFWLCVGVHNLTLSLLYGKLIEVTSRGQLMLVSTGIGSVIAIVSAWYLMRPWLSEDQGFVSLFLFTSIAFLAAAFLALWLIEEPDARSPQSKPIGESLRLSFAILKQDQNFRLLAWIAVCYGMSITLIPHYQAYVKLGFGMGLVDFVPLIIAQNLGAAAFSIPLGKVADNFGNRLALQITMITLCLSPILSMLLVNGPESYVRAGSMVLFFLLGLTPVSMRTFSNYTLEIADRESQPIFLSLLGVCMAAPAILFSTFVGAAVDWWSFEAAFSIVVTIMLLGWILTFRLSEPRHNDSNHVSVGPSSGPRS